MKFIVLILFMMVSLFSGEPVALEKKYSKSTKCIACHKHIVEDWKDSWHAKSHFKNDEYYRETLKYMARKMRSKNLDTLKVECASCHNPRISITKTTIDDEIASVMGLDKRVSKAVNNDELNEGINCAVCHNIDQIHNEKPQDVRGVHRIQWMKAGVMSGPYDDAKSPYHKTLKRDFMNENPNKLCFVCHANKRTTKGLVFTNMQEDYAKVKGAKLCVDCHMSEREMGEASNLAIDNGKTRKRLIRRHRFEGAHTARMIRNSLNLSLKTKNSKLEITLKNLNPHSIPSGYGGREIVIDVEFFAMKKIPMQSLSLTSRYINKRGKISVPHLAVNSIEDTSIPAMGTKGFTVSIPKGAQKASVSVWYKLVNDDIVKLLNLKEKRWSKKHLIVKQKLNLE